MYCLAGNLQSVLDEYAHILVESPGIRGGNCQEIADGVSEAIASEFRGDCKTLSKDPWEALFQTARDSRTEGQNDLFPFWISAFGDAKIQRHIPSLPLSRDTTQYADLLRTLVLYRMVFGQNRQEDLVQYLLTRLPEAEVERIAELCRVDLSPV